MDATVLVDKSRVQCVERIWAGDMTIDDGIKWAIDQNDDLESMRYEIGAPSLWYITWYSLYVRSNPNHPPSWDANFNNPLVVWNVALFEALHLEKRMGSPMGSQRSEASEAGTDDYLDRSTVTMMLERKPLAHDELHRAQQLHIALTITRQMSTASKELNIAHSSQQVQRKWIPDPWVAHLCADVFKHFVNQILILERWRPGFIHSTILFASDMQRAAIKAAISKTKQHIIHVSSHTSAHIIDSDFTSLWFGEIKDVASAWIALSSECILKERTRTQRL